MIGICYEHSVRTKNQFASQRFHSNKPIPHTFPYTILNTSPSAANYTPAGQISLLLSGTCLSVPYEANLSPIMQKLQESQSKVPSTTPRTVGLGLNSGSKYASLSLPR